MTRILGTFPETKVEANIELDRLIGTHLCIQGNSGAGKSGAIRRLLECTYGQLQHIVLDVEDEFYTLREKFEYLIAGGENGDCAATPNNAAALALMLLETGFSAVVQINELHIDDRREFIANFLDALIAAPKALWHPALIVLDEAQSYAPQVGNVASSDAVVSLMTLGRKRGFTGVLATPRISSISKDATGPVNNWLMGRVGQPTDRRTTADALGFRANSEEARGLQKLTTRTFWAFGPALSLEPQMLRIADAETTVIKAGMAAVPTPPAPAAMQKMLEAMNAAAKPAEETVAIVKPQSMGKTDIGASGYVTMVGDGEMATRLKAAKAEGDAEGYNRGRAEGRLSGIASGRRHITGLIGQIRDAVDAVIVEAERLCEKAFDEARCNVPISDVAGEPVSALADDLMSALDAVVSPPKASQPAKAVHPSPRAAVDGKLPGAGAALLAAFARYPDRGLTWEEACIVSGTRAGNGHFYGGKKALLGDSLVFPRADGSLNITAGGFEAAGRPEATPLRRRDLVEIWSSKLRSPSGKMLEFLAANPRRDVPDTELAEAIGTKTGNGHWYGGISQLRDAGLIEQNGKSVRLSKFLAEAK